MIHELSCGRALAIVGTALLQALSSVASVITRASATQGMAFDLRNALFGRIMTLSLADLDLLQTGRLITRVSSDVDQVRMFAGFGLMMLVGSLILIFLTGRQLAWVLLVLLPAAIALQ